MQAKGYALTAAFGLAPDYVVQQLLESCALGEGSKQSLALLMGAAGKPHVWRAGAAAAEETAAAKSVRGGKQKEKRTRIEWGGICDMYPAGG